MTVYTIYTDSGWVVKKLGSVRSGVTANYSASFQSARLFRNKKRALGIAKWLKGTVYKSVFEPWVEVKDE